MSANTLASALAAARRCSLPPVVHAHSIRPSAPPPAAMPAKPGFAPAVAAQSTVLSNAEALMVAIQRSARTVDDIMTRRMLLGSRDSGLASSR